MNAESDRRSGSYVQQPRGYRAFLPKPLPPQPPVRMDDEMWMVLSEADRALGRLDGATETLPNPDLFVFMYVRKEAVLSSQIEGTQASLIDVLEFEANALERGNDYDVTEVINYVSAMNYALNRVKQMPLSLRLLREIHGTLMAGTRGGERNPGEFRTSQNWIGPLRNHDLSTARYVPPPPYEMQVALGNLEGFLYDPHPMPVLIRVGLAHAQFETIHPFLDGNGRMGRLLITFLLCEKDIVKRPLLYLSYYFKQHRQEYYNLLQATRDAGDWEGWLKFFLDGVRSVADEATRTARDIIAMREAHREMVRDHFGRGAARALLAVEGLYFNPIVSVNWVMERPDLAFARANELVREFVDLGLLAEITGLKRNRRYSYEPYLALFADPLTETPQVENAE